MPRLIDADALMDVVRQHEYCLATKQGSVDYGMFTPGIQQAVDEQPTIEAEPVRHGVWVCGDYYDVGDVCSECDWDSERVPCDYRYCPNCGCKMNKEE